MKKEYDLKTLKKRPGPVKVDPNAAKNEDARLANRKIKYAKKSLLAPDEFDPKYVKVMVSARLDKDVLKAVKAAAGERGIDYKTLINQILKDHFKLTPR